MKPLRASIFSVEASTSQRMMSSASSERASKPSQPDEVATRSRAREAASSVSCGRRSQSRAIDRAPQSPAASRWGAVSAHPLIVVLLERLTEGRDTADSTVRAMSLIESYLVRRHLVGMTTTGLTQLFIRVSQELAIAGDSASGVEIGLLDEPAYWPSDLEVRDAVLTRPFYISGRPAQRQFVLTELERTFEVAEPVDLNAADLTIEHVLPQTLSTAWVSHLVSLGDDPAEVHSSLVHTLGNLTLTAFNGTLSNHPMERKRQIYAASNLALNASLQHASRFGGSTQIRERGEDLAGRVIARWQGPRGRRSVVMSTYDSPSFWRPLEQLIARIPKAGGRRPATWPPWLALARPGLRVIFKTYPASLAHTELSTSRPLRRTGSPRTP